MFLLIYWSLQAFYPYLDYEIYALWDNKTVKQYEEKFQYSYMVHFYGSQTKDFGVDKQTDVEYPWLTAYNYLGPRFCPDSFQISDSF